MKEDWKLQNNSKQQQFWQLLCCYTRMLFQWICSWLANVFVSIFPNIDKVLWVSHLQFCAVSVVFHLHAINALGFTFVKTAYPLNFRLLLTLLALEGLSHFIWSTFRPQALVVWRRNGAGPSCSRFQPLKCLLHHEKSQFQGQKLEEVGVGDPKNLRSVKGPVYKI